MSASNVLPPLPYSSHELWSPNSTKAFNSLPSGKQVREWLYGTPLSPAANNKNSENLFFTTASINISPSSSRPIMVQTPHSATTATTRDGIPSEIIVVIKRTVEHTNAVLDYHQHDHICQSKLQDDDISLLNDDLEHEGENDYVEMHRLPDATYNVVVSVLSDDTNEIHQGNTPSRNNVSDTSNWTMGSLCYSKDRSVDIVENSNNHLDLPLALQNQTTVCQEQHCSNCSSPKRQSNSTATGGFYSNALLHDYGRVWNQLPAPKHTEHQDIWGVHFR